jgi:hypothetical protein
MPSDANRADGRAVARSLSVLEFRGAGEPSCWCACSEERESVWLEWEQSYLTATVLRCGDLDGFKH